MQKKSMISLLLPVIIAGCSSVPGVNLNTNNANKAEINSQIASTLKQRMKVYNAVEASKIFKVVKGNSSGMGIKANAAEPIYEIQHATRPDAQCVKVVGINGSNQAIAIFNTQGDTYTAGGSSEAYFVTFAIDTGTITSAIQSKGMEFSDVHIGGNVEKAEIFLIGDDSSNVGADTAFIAKFTYDYKGEPTIAPSDLLLLEGRNATSIMEIDSKNQTFGVTTGENGFIYVIAANRPGFTIKQKIAPPIDPKGMPLTAGDFRASSGGSNPLNKFYVLDGGWSPPDPIIRSGTQMRSEIPPSPVPSVILANASKPPAILELTNIDGTFSITKTFPLPFSSLTTGIGKDFAFGTTVGTTEKPGGRLARAEMVLFGEHLLVAAASGGLVSLRADGTAVSDYDFTALVNKGPTPDGTPAIMNGITLLGENRDGSVKIGASSGYNGIVTMDINPAQGTATRIDNYRLFENTSLIGTDPNAGTSTNSMSVLSSIDAQGIMVNYVGIGNGVRGATVFPIKVIAQSADLVR